MTTFPDLPCGHARLTFGCSTCLAYARGEAVVVTGSKAQVVVPEATFEELARRVGVLCQAAEAVWAVASVPRVVDQWRNLDRSVTALVERCERLKTRLEARRRRAR